MENIINSLQENNLYLVIFGILAVYLVFSIIKKLVKFVLIAAILIIGYLAWLHWTGADDSRKEAPETTEQSS